MTQTITKALLFLRLANFIVILGSSITWTGLSYDLALKYQEPRFMALMQTLSVIASLIGPFISLWLNSHFPLRSITVSNEIIASICCALIFCLLQYDSTLNFHIIITFSLLVFLILLSGAVGSLFIEPLYANLVEKRDGSDKNLKEEFATFACFGIFSKLCGMSMGPYLFALISQYSLVINGICFFISAYLLWLAINYVPKDVGIVAIRSEKIAFFKKSTWEGIVKPPLFETAIANSLIFIVVLAMSTQAMTLQATPTQLSFFWFGATGCAFFSHFLLSRFKVVSEILFRLEKKSGFLQIVPVFTGLMTHSISVLLVSQWIFSLCNPLATNQSRAGFYQFYGRDNEKALNAYAIRSIFTNVIVFSFSLFVSISGTKEISFFIAIALSGFILLRWETARKVQLENHHEKVSL